jgi:hypothetical protein
LARERAKPYVVAMSKTALSKDALIVELRRLLADAFDNQRRGAQHARIGRAYGYIDGYMRVMIDTGIATDTELLAVVAEARVKHAGPATANLEFRAA